jgi:hypothetical protein
VAEPPGPNDAKSSISRKKGRSVTYVILIIVAALLLGGLWYLRGRKA